MEKPNKIYYIMGVSGSGKSSIGKALAEQLSLPYLEADDFHPEANIKKMSTGQALNDKDRTPWLESIRTAAMRAYNDKGAVISCSALKQKYRDLLADGFSNPVIWIYLEGSFELIHNRMKHRAEHFMPESLLRSQFDALEIPQDAIKVNIAESTEDILRNLLEQIN